MSDHADVFDSYVEEGTVFERRSTGGRVTVEGIALDEDARVHVYITDEEAGYDNDSVYLGDLVDAVERGELRQLTARA
jgi:hypothetical protein